MKNLFIEDFQKGSNRLYMVESKIIFFKNNFDCVCNYRSNIFNFNLTAGI